MKRFLLILWAFCTTWMVQAQTSDTAYVQSGVAALHCVRSLPGPTGQAKNAPGVTGQGPNAQGVTGQAAGKDVNARMPLAVFIAGSGPTDLNGNQTGMMNNSLLLLSDALVKQGITTVRFDKRGVGKSLAPGFREVDATIEMFSGDVQAIVSYYRGLGYKDIFLVGHSEGSLIGLIAAGSASPKGMVSLCGPGTAADELLLKQLKPQLPADMFTRVSSILDSLKRGLQVPNAPVQLNSLFRPSVQPYLISWFRHHPATLAGRLSCPLLAIGGGKDLQVEATDAQILGQAAKQGRSLVINNMNHVLKNIPGGAQENMGSYTRPDLPVNDSLVNAVVRFIRNPAMP